MFFFQIQPHAFITYTEGSKTKLFYLRFKCILSQFRPNIRDEMSWKRQLLKIHSKNLPVHTNAILKQFCLVANHWSELGLSIETTNQCSCFCRWGQPPLVTWPFASLAIKTQTVRFVWRVKFYDQSVKVHGNKDDMRWVCYGPFIFLILTSDTCQRNIYNVW